MREPAIPSFPTEHRRAGGAPSYLDRHAGQTPSRFADQPGAARQRPGLATPGAQIWRSSWCHQAQAARFGARRRTQEDVRTLAGYADSVSFCLSKGLACPVGSLLCGTRDFVAQGRSGAQAARRRDAPGGNNRGGGHRGAVHDGGAAGRGSSQRARSGRRPGIGRGHQRAEGVAPHQHGLLRRRRRRGLRAKVPDRAQGTRNTGRPSRRGAD